MNNLATFTNGTISVHSVCVYPITRSEYLAHTRPLFQRTQILDLDNIRKLSLGIYCYKNRDSFDHLLAAHNYPTRNRNRLRPVRHRTSQFKKSFIYQAPIIWNEINTQIPEIDNIGSLAKFKHKYKNLL